jgi:glutaredoxin
MSRFVLLWITLVMCGLAQSGELYRWVDAQGKVHYGDVPPVTDAQLRLKEITLMPPPKDDVQYMPYETRWAQQNFPVTLFASKNCGEYCEQARELLIKRGIPFTETLLDNKKTIAALKSAAGSSRVPTLQVGHDYVHGFEPTQWHKALTTTGYPKASSYRQSVESSDADETTIESIDTQEEDEL